jgi:hypothetical protein
MGHVVDDDVEVDAVPIDQPVCTSGTAVRMPVDAFTSASCGFGSGENRRVE